MTFEEFVRSLAITTNNVNVRATANDYSATLHFFTEAGTRQILVTGDSVTMPPDLEI